MATVNIKPYKHHFKDSHKTMNLKLTIYHKGKYAYPPTDYFVSRSQLNKGMNKIIDKDLIANLTVDLGNYRKAISSLGRDRLNEMTPQDVANFLFPVVKNSADSIKVDFIAFGKQRVKELREEKRNSYAGTLQAVVNNFQDFVKSDLYYIQDITSDVLKKYEKHLRQPYKQIRLNQFKKEVEIDQPGMDDSGIYVYISVKVPPPFRSKVAGK